MNGIAIDVEHLVVGHAVLASGMSDHRIHTAITSCHSLCQSVSYTVFLTRVVDACRYIAGLRVGALHRVEKNGRLAIRAAVRSSLGYVGRPGEKMDMSASGRGDRPMANSYWVVPGRFAAGEYPGSLNRADADRRLRRLLRAGIDHFIDLTRPADGLEPYEPMLREHAYAERVEVRWEPHPVVDNSVPSVEAMTSILDAIDGAMEAGRTVYVHCWGGIGRTGTVVGCWLVRRGDTGDEALDRIAEWWKHVEKSWRVPRSPQTHEQHEYVRRWAER